MTRREMFWSGLSVLESGAGGELPQQQGDCPIKIKITEGPSIHVTVPSMAKKDVVEILAMFFAAMKPEMKDGIADVLNRTKDVSLTLTTQCDVERAGSTARVKR